MDSNKVYDPKYVPLNVEEYNERLRERIALLPEWLRDARAKDINKRGD